MPEFTFPVIRNWMSDWETVGTAEWIESAQLGYVWLRFSHEGYVYFLKANRATRGVVQEIRVLAPGNGGEDTIESIIAAVKEM